VACIRKGKVGKENEFGRVFQLGRIKGNFLFVLASTSLKMDDKQSLVPMLKEHEAIFGKGELKSASAGKGYWSAKNQQALINRRVGSGLQRPANIKSQQGMPSPEVQERLRNRRAGIEPLIGHVKHGGAARTKSYEERRGNIGRWVRLYPRLQFAATDEGAASGEGEGRMIKRSGDRRRIWQEERSGTERYG